MALILSKERPCHSILHLQHKLALQVRQRSIKVNPWLMNLLSRGKHMLELVVAESILLDGRQAWMKSAIKATREVPGIHPLWCDWLYPLPVQEFCPSLLKLHIKRSFLNCWTGTTVGGIVIGPLPHWYFVVLSTNLLVYIVVSMILNPQDDCCMASSAVNKVLVWDSASLCFEIRQKFRIANKLTYLFALFFVLFTSIG